MMVDIGCTHEMEERDRWWSRKKGLVFTLHRCARARIHSAIQGNVSIYFPQQASTGGNQSK